MRETCIKLSKNEGYAMSAKILISACLALALAGCGGSETSATNDVDGGTGSEAAASDGGAMQIQPGEWETTSEMVNIEAPNMPPEMAAAMKQNIGQKTTSRTCITPEEASGGEFMTTDSDAQCTKEGISFAGGRIQGSMTCTGEEGRATITMTGQHSGTSYDMRSKVVSANESGNLTMETRVTGRRLGECTAETE